MHSLLAPRTYWLRLSLFAAALWACSQQDAPGATALPDSGAPSTPAEVATPAEAASENAPADDGDRSEAVGDSEGATAPAAPAPPLPRAGTGAPRPPSARARPPASPSSSAEAGSWEDEVAPPGSEVRAGSPGLPEWDPWDADKGGSEKGK
jgi:hypothetical protein